MGAVDVVEVEFCGRCWGTVVGVWTFRGEACGCMTCAGIGIGA
jgi:hypothetical protein